MKFFVLKCPKEDTSSVLTFWSLMRNYISFEVEKKPEVFEVSSTEISPFSNILILPISRAGT